MPSFHILDRAAETTAVPFAGARRALPPGHLVDRAAETVTVPWASLPLAGKRAVRLPYISAGGNGRGRPSEELRRATGTLAFSLWGGRGVQASHLG